jgi:hypothetical protein
MKYAFTALLAAASIATFIGAANAGWMCQRTGSATYCYNNQTGQSYMCQQYGNQTICN